MDEILTDLRAEYDRLDAMLAPLGPDEWARPSAAEGGRWPTWWPTWR